MAGFRAEFDGGNCEICDDMIRKGQLIQYLRGGGPPSHVNCADESGGGGAEETKVLWNTRLIESAAMDGLEEIDPGPLQRPVCPDCRIELPKTLQCGFCG